MFGLLNVVFVRFASRFLYLTFKTVTFTSFSYFDVQIVGCFIIFVGQNEQWTSAKSGIILISYRIYNCKCAISKLCQTNFRPMELLSSSLYYGKYQQSLTNHKKCTGMSKTALIFNSWHSLTQYELVKIKFRRTSYWRLITASRHALSS